MHKDSSRSKIDRKLAHHKTLGYYYMYAISRIINKGKMWIGTYCDILNSLVMAFWCASPS